MRKVRIDSLYRLSAVLAPLREPVTDETSVVQTYLKVLRAQSEFAPFFEDWKDYLGAAKESAETINNALSHWDKHFDGLVKQGEPGKIGSAAWSFASLASSLETFETVLGQEGPRINTFVVEQVGAFSMQHVIEGASAHIDESLRAVMPASAILDYDAAGRCLAFDLFTACGFHIVRSLEAVVVAYHDLLTGVSLPSQDRNWGAILKRLQAAKAPDRLNSLLDHLKDQDRNPIIHPDRVLDRSAAITTFHLTGGTMMEFAQALKELKATKSAVAAVAASPGP